MKVIGTAGHVDHGKSSLVQALTGMNPDRLAEEQKREMTIDLGFAWLRISGEDMIGIIDVPGHRDFIENMLAGVGGIDAVLFVIAADEGIMPQTREHLAIIDLLQIPNGVIALTKIDLVSDPDWLLMVKNEIIQVMKGTVLENAEIIPVSAKTKTGISELKQALKNVLQKSQTHKDIGKPRLPIDRVFTIAGFGTIVTGTLDKGSLHSGETIEILPQGIQGRIRGLQSYKEKTDMLQPGSRAAVNVTGIEIEQVKRGDTLSLPGRYQTTKRLDVQARLLKDAQKNLKHNDTVKVFLGTSEIMARVRVLEVEDLQPGETGLLQLELGEPTVAERGDRFILRRPSPGETLGGGVVIEPHPKRIHKRFDKKIAAQLGSIISGSADEILFQILEQKGVLSTDELIKISAIPMEEANTILVKFKDQKSIVSFVDDDPKNIKNDIISTSNFWQKIDDKITHELDMFHNENPLKPGMMKEELRSRLRIDARLFHLYIEKEKRETKIAEEGALIRLSRHSIHFSPEEEKLVNKVMRGLTETPFSPPSVKELKEILGENLYRALEKTGKIVSVADDVAFSFDSIDAMKKKIVSLLQEKKKITVAEARDMLGTSRKYALAILEYFDKKGITHREGDYRILLHPDR